MSFIITAMTSTAHLQYLCCEGTLIRISAGTKGGAFFCRGGAVRLLFMSTAPLASNENSHFFKKKKKKKFDSVNANCLHWWNIIKFSWLEMDVQHLPLTESIARKWCSESICGKRGKFNFRKCKGKIIFFLYLLFLLWGEKKTSEKGWQIQCLRAELYFFARLRQVFCSLLFD